MCFFSVTDTITHTEWTSYERETVDSISLTTQSTSILGDTKVLLMGIIALIGLLVVIFSIYCTFYIFNKLCQRRRGRCENVSLSYHNIHKGLSAVDINPVLHTDGLETIRENLELSEEMREVCDHYERVKENVDDLKIDLINTNQCVDVISSVNDTYLNPI